MEGDGEECLSGPWGRQLGGAVSGGHAEGRVGDPSPSPPTGLARGAFSQQISPAREG